jgi:muramoyltetrapeptide carboxypeptidase
MMPWPRPLAAGARVALVAPAYALPEGAAAVAAERLHALGLEVVPGRHLAARDGPWAGSVAERLADLRWALGAADVDAVWLARGGEGTAAVAIRLERGDLARSRPVLGMSDATFLHSRLARAGVPSVHAPMPATGEGQGWDDWAAGAALAAVGREPPWTVEAPPLWPSPRTLVRGRAEGVLVGGNLTVLAATAGTRLRPPTRRRILFLEEIGEAAYRVDRALEQLTQAGMLRDVAGVAVGSLVDCPPSGGLTAEAVFERHLAPLGVPVAFGLPLGHGAARAAVPLGVRVALDADLGTLTVLEAAWRRADVGSGRG